MPELRALTVRQPYAWAIADLGKDVENRPWLTHYRGLVAIHAAGKFYESFPGFPVRTADRAYRAVKAKAELAQALPPDVPRIRPSRIVAVARLADVCDGQKCEPNMCSPWSIHGETHWHLADVRALPDPVPCKGKLGLWRLPADVEAAVRGQLEESNA